MTRAGNSDLARPHPRNYFKLTNVDDGRDLTLHMNVLKLTHIGVSVLHVFGVTTLLIALGVGWYMYFRPEQGAGVVLYDL